MLTLDQALAAWHGQPDRIQETSGLSGARTYRLIADGDYYLKIGKPGALRAEADALRYFARYGCVPALIAYRRADRDFLLTRGLPGLPAAHPDRLRDPARLAEALGRILRRFHDQPMMDCPLSNSVSDMLARVEHTVRRRRHDAALAAYVGEPDPAVLYRTIRAHANCLRDDVVLHGDYCLPNILLDADYRLAGFLDMGAAGRGDRHYDLFWGRWSLQYNLKTDRYGDHFFEAYGLDAIEPRRLQVIGAIACLDE